MSAQITYVTQRAEHVDHLVESLRLGVLESYDGDLAVVTASGDLATFMFTDEQRAEASESDAILVVFDGASYPDRFTDELHPVERVEPVQSFSDLPQILKIFIGGVEGQLQTRVAYVGYHHYMGDPVWIYVPSEFAMRFPSQ